jgi:hypothetical protein
MLWSLMTANVANVTESPGGDHSTLRTLVLKDRIRGDGRAMKDLIDSRELDRVSFTQLGNAVKHTHGRVLRRCGHFVNPRATADGVMSDHIGECASYINTNQLRHIGIFSRISKVMFLFAN